MFSGRTLTFISHVSIVKKNYYIMNHNGIWLRTSFCLKLGEEGLGLAHVSSPPGPEKKPQCGPGSYGGGGEGGEWDSDREFFGGWWGELGKGFLADFKSYWLIPPIPIP